MPGYIDIGRTIRTVFEDAQVSNGGHRKLVVNLATIQAKAATIANTSEDPLDGERQFNETFLSCLNCVLVVKKAEPGADRIVKFCDQFIQYIQAKEVKDRAGKPESDEEEDGETVSTRFIDSLINHLLRGLDAKDKIVRYRACQFIAVIIGSLGEMDDALFQRLCLGLRKRTRDRESSVRVRAVIALSRLQSDEQDEEDDDDDSIIELMIHLLQHDPSTEVRRAVLLNLQQSPNTLSYILERSRDVDAINRRYVFSKSLKELGDFRLLSIGMREKVLKWGLEDRDANVRKAAGRMFATGWIEHTDNNLLDVKFQQAHD